MADICNVNAKKNLLSYKVQGMEKGWAEHRETVELTEDENVYRKLPRISPCA